MFRPTRASVCGCTLVVLVGFLTGSRVLLVRGQEPTGNSAANGKARVDAVANAQTPRHKEIEMLTLSQASAIVDRALAYARGHDLHPMTIAVLDARGCIVALKMEDGAGLMRPDIAVGKAWGALGMGFGTRNFAASAQAAPQFYGALADLAKGRVVPVPGGVLVRDQEQRLIGAVGASGDTSDNDEAMVLAGIAAVSGLVADPGQAPPPPEKTTTIRAYHLYTGEDGNSHVDRGSVRTGESVEAESILFKETPPHSSLDWHNDPILSTSSRCPASWNSPPRAARHSPSIPAKLCWPRIRPAPATSGVWSTTSRGNGPTSSSRKVRTLASYRIRRVSGTTSTAC
jgi:uncharacterized protein GlcG (DUF336 family)